METRRVRRIPKEQMAEDFKEEVAKESTSSAKKTVYREPLLVSTGSTLLDKAIYGGRHPEGGVPCGLMIEIFGPEGIGKTGLACELCGSAQARGGSVRFNDPEARLDREYAEIYGMNLQTDAGEGYLQTGLVDEIFNDVRSWDPANTNVPNVYACDSLAALSTKLEMENPDGDKMGMRRAKEFSEGLRKTCRHIKQGGHKLLVCTNQIRQGDSGNTTPGGNAIRYYSSVRVAIKYVFGGGRSRYLTKEITLHGKKQEKVVGINCVAEVVKNSQDDPYRKAPLCFIFGYGIDDIRANLQWQKEVTKDTVYQCGDGKTYQAMDAAIQYVEENGLELKLKENVIALWDEIEEAFDEKLQRKPKRR